MKQSEQFRYNCEGKWFKGNTHVHSLASDGGKTFEELSDLYCGAGYDFLFRTDHWVFSDVSNDTESHPLLWIDGVEIDGQGENGSFFHIICLGKTEGLSHKDSLSEALAAAHGQGCVVIIAHPYWSGNSLDDAVNGGFHGVEVYNHVARWLNGKSDSAVYWSAMLEMNANTLSFSCDDTHLTQEETSWNGGWIVVNAPELSREAILGAIRNGNFYSSCGPDFRNIEFDGATVRITTSPVLCARLVGPGSFGKRGSAEAGRLFTQTDIDVPEEWPYAYLEIEDAAGRRAWTNTLFRSVE